MIALQIPHYRIIRELGRGAMGMVYEAEHTKLTRRVAIKVVHPEHARDPELETRFLNEARALARLSHPNIVKIFGFGFLPDGTSYLVMEYLEGETLAKRWQKGSPKPDLLAELKLLQQLTQALTKLHSHGVVHRDLKPENTMVMIAPGATPRLQAKLVDFGLAKLIRLSGQKTANSLIMGTPAYMSPEQCRGAGQVGAKTDCYALGVMLYELIAGQLPFESQWAGDLIGMHLHVEPAPLVKHAADVDPRLATLVHGLLTKDQDRRPAMADVAAYLLALIDHLEQRHTGPLPSLNPEIDPYADTRIPDLVEKSLAAIAAVQPVAAAAARVDTPSPAASPQHPPAVVALSPDRQLAAKSAARPPAGFNLATRLLKKSYYLQYAWVVLTLTLVTIGLLRPGDRPAAKSALVDQQSSLLPPTLPGGLEPAPAHNLETDRLRSVVSTSQADDQIALRRQRVSGADPELPALSELLACHSIAGVYQLSVHPDGKVQSVEPVVSIPGADSSIMKTLAGWQFERRSAEESLRVPLRFQIDRKQDKCTTYPAAPLPLIQVAPSALVENMKGGIYLPPSWPAALNPLARCEVREASYTILIDQSGEVTSVAPVHERADNHHIITELGRWRFRRLAYPVSVTYAFTFKGAGNATTCGWR